MAYPMTAKTVVRIVPLTLKNHDERRPRLAAFWYFFQKKYK